MNHIVSASAINSCDAPSLLGKPNKTKNDTNGFEALLVGIVTDTSQSPISTSSVNTVSAEDIAAGNNGNSLFDFIQQLLADAENSLVGANTPATSSPSNIFATMLKNTSSAGSSLASGGPLPAFISEVTARLHLDVAHEQALKDIAAKNMDIVKTPETVQKIAMELQLAGIG
jgi:hypothetical protein